MPLNRQSLTNIARSVGFAVLGLVATALLGIGLLYLTRDLQTVIYDALYLSIGPSDATRLAMLGQFTVVAATALVIPSIAVAAISGDRLPESRTLTRGLAIVAGILAVLVLAIWLRVVPFLAGLLIAAILLLAVLLAGYRWYGIDSPALPTLAGGVPVIVLMFLLLAFGMGWGWGYVLVAQTAQPGSVSGTTVADFDEVSQVRDDLFTDDNCSGLSGGGQECFLSLRGYAHELVATRWLARHGVRCPYVNAPPGRGRDAGSFLAKHDGQYYRVTCSPHGD